MLQSGHSFAAQHHAVWADSVEKLRFAKMLIFRRLRVARESQTGIRLREREGAQQGQRSVLADPVAKYNYSTCVAKNVPDLSQKQSFSTLSAETGLCKVVQNHQ